eukprot:3036930-Rhodomonas_salina.2
MVLRACYALSGTESSCGPTRLICGVRYWASVWSYARATRCPLLRQHMVLGGDGEVRAVKGIAEVAGATPYHLLRHVRYCNIACPMSLLRHV